jgi:uncharacterized membrane protein required for colicin V production
MFHKSFSFQGNKMATRTKKRVLVKKKPVKPRGTPMTRRLIYATLLFGPAIIFGLGGDYLVAGVCGMAAIGALWGYRTGAVSFLTSLIALAAAFFFAPAIGQSYEYHFSQWFGTTGLMNRVLSVGVFGVLLAFVIAGLMTLISLKVLSSRPLLDATNRWLGLIIGAAQAPVAALFFIGGLMIIEPAVQQRVDDPNAPRAKFTTKLVLQTAEMTRESKLGPLVEKYNPFLRVPELNKLEPMHRSVQILSDPAQIQRVLGHPSIRQLQEREDMRRTVEKLASDPKIQEVLASGKRMDKSMAMVLLKHPAVLELLDQPDFVEQASQVMAGMNIFGP